eukprot:TRINITY_DN2977_c0_g1_i2.p1 TRINITY_DN2977_c0_g1~~TRINITY_DN2977_c0_g1_i2.p1  ORF type:complete len:565 (-),score=115.45 TRINITY_DN2977_c0_g1_i2:3-1652(-)
MRLVVLLNLLITFFFCCCFGFNSSQYERSRTLVDGYTIYWTITNDTLRLGLQVATNGWIGFGIGEETSGSMPGADVLVANVRDGVASVTDMYTLAKVRPYTDDCQNWKLISGSEDGNTTIIEVERVLDTGDKQDRPIKDSNRIIFAWGIDDYLAYHNSNRRSTVVDWRRSNSTSNVFADALYIDFLNTNYTIPSQVTTYERIVFSNRFTSDISVVGFEPIVKTKFVHHYIVYGSITNSTQYDLSWEMIWGWAPGINSLKLPQGTGFTFGPKGYITLILEIHYDNPQVMVGQMDQSGFRLYYETTLRPIEAAVLQLGDSYVSNPDGISAGTGLQEFEYDCPSACTSSFSQTLHVFANILHMHSMGRQIWGVQWRNGTMVRETNRVDFWDFAYQQTTPKDHTIEPGDRISTHCVYAQGASVVPFSLSSSDEMCLQYIFYYPKVNKTYCSFYNPKNASSSMNMTLCGKDPLPMSNPTQKDPIGGRTIVFGTQNPSSYCTHMDSNVSTVTVTPSDGQSVITTLQTISTITMERWESSTITISIVFSFIIVLLI